jgi:hypothetical protein
LRHCALQIKRGGPSAAAVGAELTAKALGGKTKQLPQEVVSFGVDGTSGLEHEGGEEEGLMMKASVVLLVLPSGILKDIERGLVTATSMAMPLPEDQIGIVTSPGRRPEVGPRIPFFSMTGLRRASEAMRFTKLRTALCLTIRSPE